MPFGTTSASIATSSPPRAASTTGKRAVKRVEAARHCAPSRDLHKTFAAEPELQLHGETCPFLGHFRAGREPNRDTDLRPEITRLEVVRFALSGDEPPTLDVTLIGVTPEPQLLDAAGMAL